MDSSWSLSNADFIQNIATLVWIHKNDPKMSEKVAAARIGYELYQRLSGEREAEALRNQTIAKIVQYVQSHPHASKDELQKEIGKQIMAFAEQVERV